jgi:hypothetical protein
MSRVGSETVHGADPRVAGPGGSGTRLLTRQRPGGETAGTMAAERAMSRRPGCRVYFCRSGAGAGSRRLESAGVVGFAWRFDGHPKRASAGILLRAEQAGPAENAAGTGRSGSVRCATPGVKPAELEHPPEGWPASRKGRSTSRRWRIGAQNSAVGRQCAHAPDARLLAVSFGDYNAG